MKMSHDDLVLLLAEALNVDQEQAEETLSSWAKSVRAEVLEKGEYQVPGLGTFKEIDGKPGFLPEEELAVEVNYKYAGMNPIEIMSAFSSSQKQDEDQKHSKESEPASREESDFDTGEMETGTGERAPDADKKDESATSFEEVFGVDSTEEATPEASDEASEPVPPPEEPSTIPEAEPVGISDSGSSKEYAGKKESSDATRKSAQSPKSKDRPASGERQSRVWMLPIAAALILAVMLYFHFEGRLLHQQYTEEAALSGTRSEEPAETGLGPEPSEHQLEATREEEAAAAEEAEGLPFGLMGSEEELLIGSYTIVLHSIANENRARIEMENLIDEGYKATLWQAQLGNGGYTWRVGVGQFETVSDAENAISRLPEPYRSNNFIIRIR